MDRKLIEQYGEGILCYRLRTARQKKRMQYEDFDKRLLKIHSEQKKLSREKRNLGWEPLLPPVQKGWKRFFVLREDVARSKDAAFFEGVLKKINTYDWSHRRDFKVKKRRMGKKTYVVKRQQLLQPNENHFTKLDFTEAEKRQFHPELHFNRWHKGYELFYVFNEPWRFVLRVRPNMIDKIKKVDPALEARLREIGDYLEKNHYSGKLLRLLYGNNRWSCWRYSERAKEKNPLRNKPVQRILDEIKNGLL